MEEHKKTSMSDQFTLVSVHWLVRHFLLQNRCYVASHSASITSSSLICMVVVYLWKLILY